MAKEWTNWSGSVTSNVQALELPNREEEVIGLLRRAEAESLLVRVTGSGHSFVPLCRTQGMLLYTDGLQGVVSTDSGAKEAVVRGGTKLYLLGGPLRQAGLAMENLPDIDRQSISGAIGTGTHGTGDGIGNLANQVVGLRFVTAAGEVINCSDEEEPAIFKSAQVSLGALGIMTEVRLRLVPTFRLHEKIWRVPVAECLKNLEKMIQENRHFEFFWGPKQDACLMKALNPTAHDPDDLPEVEGERIGHSDRVFPSERRTKFNEMEFSVPRVSGVDCFLEIRRMMKEKHPEVRWPLEYRTVAADDIYLSPAYRRDTVAISAHQAADIPQGKFFADVEAIFRNHQGRPHWGKMHTHIAADLRELYPMWEKFQEVRRRLDPKGRFMNPYLAKIFHGPREMP